MTWQPSTYFLQDPKATYIIEILFKSFLKLIQATLQFNMPETDPLQAHFWQHFRILDWNLSMFFKAFP